jgi:hypothetical protein
MSDLDDDQKRRIFLQVCDEMRDYTASSMSAVYGIVSESSGRLVGGGTFLRLHGATYLLTAAHVAERMLDHERLAHTSSYGARPQLIQNPLVCQPLPLDVAIVRIEESAVQAHSLKSWPATILADRASNTERDILFVHGFPGEKSKWLPIVNGGIHSESLPFGTSDATSIWPHYDPDLHLAVIYPPDGWFDNQGRSIDMPNPEGLSGSALWQTYRREHPEDWDTGFARIIGVIHRYDPDAHSLIATRIEPISEFIIRVLRRESAYFRWQNRGQPTDDDWSDWFASASDIRSLA